MEIHVKLSFGEVISYTSPQIGIIRIDSEAMICQSSVTFGNPGGAGSDILDDNITNGGDF